MSALYPQNNASRMTLDLGGIWDFRFRGDENWQPIAVPASYNDQSPDPRFRNYAGISEYRRKITVPAAWKGMRFFLRFDAAAHSARILLNGTEIASHRGGFLPFEVELNGRMEAGETAELTVETDNRISHNTLPIGTEGETAFFGSDNPGIPSVEAGKRMQQERGINRPAFDFFNYTGLQRPVRLAATPTQYIRDVTLVPSVNGEVRYQVVVVVEPAHVAVAAGEERLHDASPVAAERHILEELPRLVARHGVPGFRHVGRTLLGHVQPYRGIDRVP